MSTSAVPDAEVMARIGANLAEVEARLQAACDRAGRPRSAVALVAASKTRSPQEIVAAFRCGVACFGENRVEEAEPKIPAVNAALAPERPAWHLIGHIQSRKAERAVRLADLIHGVDSLSLARRLDRLAGEAGRTLPVLLECNVSGEASKYGFPAWDDETLAATLAACANLAALAHLQVRGLMTMAPIGPAPEAARPHFRRLAAVVALLRERLPFSDWQELSMGMTDDFEVAVEEGATMVRIGRAIFGPRDYTGEKQND
jgi:pyridoxal phosphate enzyme (YggS family)